MSNADILAAFSSILPTKEPPVPGNPPSVVSSSVFDNYIEPRLVRYGKQKWYMYLMSDNTFRLHCDLRTPNGREVRSAVYLKREWVVDAESYRSITIPIYSQMINSIVLDAEEE